jgi:hypothetical protein
MALAHREIAMNKHTQGPWELCHGGYGGPSGFVIDEYYVLNRTVADDVAIAADIVDPATQMPSEANARLIAAAPELLEALQLVECVYRKNCVNEGEPSSVLDSMQAAIAKATGEA